MNNQIASSGFDARYNFNQSTRPIPEKQERFFAKAAPSSNNNKEERFR